MNDRRQRMLDRAKKLMAIANDDAASVNEAAMALSQAQKIMDQYALETWMLEQDGAQACEQVEERHIAAPNKGNDQYFLAILGPIAKANACRAFTSTLDNRHNGYTLVGRPTDLDTVETLFTMVSLYEAAHWRDNLPDWKKRYPAPKRLTASERRLWTQRIGQLVAPMTRKWHKSYIIGFGEAIRQRLSGHTVTTSTGQDLISLKTQPVEDYIQRNMSITYKNIHTALDHDAYKNGMESGRNVNLNQTGITNPTLQISR